jgi:hypothetical protein
MGKTIAYGYQPILIVLSVVNVIRRCFMATTINLELSGVFQYQLENIHCFNVTHKSTGFARNKTNIRVQIIEISHLINYTYTKHSPLTNKIINS